MELLTLVGLTLVLCGFCVYVLRLVVGHAEGERKNLRAMTERTYSYLSARSPQEVVHADMERRRLEIGLSALENELTQLEKKKSRATPEAEDEFAVTSDGRRIPWENLRPVDNGISLEDLIDQE